MPGIAPEIIEINTLFLAPIKHTESVLIKTKTKHKSKKTFTQDLFNIQTQSNAKNGVKNRNIWRLILWQKDYEAGSSGIKSKPTVGHSLLFNTEMKVTVSCLDNKHRIRPACVLLKNDWARRNPLGVLKINFSRNQDWTLHPLKWNSFPWKDPTKSLFTYEVLIKAQK